MRILAFLALVGAFAPTFAHAAGPAEPPAAAPAAPAPTVPVAAPAAAPDEAAPTGEAATPAPTPGTAPERMAPAEGSTLIHWSEAQVKVRAAVTEADYPAEAKARHLPDERCVVRIRIDERGVPYDVVPRSCADLFVPSAKSIGMRYRFYPLKREGVAIKAEFDLTLNFKAAPGP